MIHTWKKIIFVLLTLTVLNLIGCSNSSKYPDSKALKINYKIKSGKDMTIYIASDIHYLSKNLTDGGEAIEKYINSSDGKQLNYIDEILNAFIYDIKNKKPDILILSGDLTNSGEKESHRDLAEKLKEIEDNGTSVYVIPGNHDILSPWARGFEGDKQYVTEYINSNEFSRIYGDFGYNEVISRDKNSLSYLTAPSRDIWLLMLDTNHYKDNMTFGVPDSDGSISKETLQWIQWCSNLAKEKGAKIIPVMHHNLEIHNTEFQKGYTIDNSEEVMNEFEKCGLDLTLSGHIHIQDISSCKMGKDTLYDIATGSLAVYPQHYGILKYSPKDSSLDYSTSSVDVEDWSKRSGIKDKNLNNFKTYSKDFFGNFAYDMAYNELSDGKGFTEEQIKLMSEAVRVLNLRFFSGTEYLNSYDVVNSKGFKLWDASSNNFLKRYVKSIVEDKDTDDNKLHIILKH